MWSGYESLPDVAEILEYSKEHTERVHVSGHITKEDLEQVIEIIKPDKLIIHHTSASEEDENNLVVLSGVELLKASDGKSICL